MISITGEMRDLINSALADRLVCFVATASSDGQPQIAMKGSVIVYNDDTLAYWERGRRTTLENVRQNPQVVIFYRNPEKRYNWRFHGSATLEESGPIREEVMGRAPQAELDRDPERLGAAVLIKIDKIDELSGNVLQER